MKCAIVGCGFIADYYANTRRLHPQLEWIGAFDRDRARLDAAARHWQVRAFRSLEEVCADSQVEMVLNLTNPRSHAEVTRQCLEAGKHVYSEKPVGASTEEALALAVLAEDKGVRLASAPCSLLGETAQSLWQALRRGVVGKVRLVYGNFEDGMIAPKAAPWNWKNGLNVPWPARDEFETGCTVEHAGYLLTWLGAFFGPAQGVTAFSSCLIPDKGIAVSRMAPDFSVGCVEYRDGLVARLTFGLVAPRDKSLLIVGDDGVLFVGNVRDDAGPIFIRHAELSRWQSLLASRLGWLDRILEARYQWPGVDTLFQRRYPLCKPAAEQFASAEKRVDFLRGPAELAEAVAEQRPSRLSPRFAAHVVEVSERLQHPERFASKTVLTSFDPIEPMPWAR
jgi:predicted dehydrogenase